MSPKPPQVHQATAPQGLSINAARSARPRDAAGIAHDLHNLLFAIKAQVDLACKSLNNNHPARHHMGTIREALHEGGSLASRLLGEAKPLDNACPAKPFDLGQLTRRSVELLRGTLPRSVHLKAHVPEHRTFPISAPSIDLQRVVLNLLNNARQAMPNGGALTVRLSTGSLCGGLFKQHASGCTHAELHVRDTGIGMNDEVLERIFDLHFTTRRTQGGRGLGMSVVRRLLVACEGTIQLRSHVGQGTTVSVVLPLHTATSRRSAPPTLAFSPWHARNENHSRWIRGSIGQSASPRTGRRSERL